MKLYHPELLGVAAACLIAAVLWGRSAARLRRARTRMVDLVNSSKSELATKSGVGQPVPSAAKVPLDKSLEDAASETPDHVALVLAGTAYRKNIHTAMFYLVISAACVVGSLLQGRYLSWVFLACVLPVGYSLFEWRRFLAEGRLVEERASLERRAEEIIEQNDLAPVRWSERLAPERLPEIEGFETAHYYQPGAGAMAGDFYDLYPTSPTRLAAAIGDVTGHGVEPAITAFQIKNLLRVFLRQFRDPAQALEELNAVVSAQGRAQGRPEEMVSVCVVVFDQSAGTLRFASAGHPAAWYFHAGEVKPLRATGPILALDPKAAYFSREIPMDSGDVLLLYTDGLVEVRSGEELFGEDRVAAALGRDPRQSVKNLVDNLVESARDFSDQPFNDDVALLAIRCE